MAFINHERLRKVSAGTRREQDAIKEYMRDRVDAWIAKRGSDVFTVRDLLSGVDRTWKTVPLGTLTDHYISNGSKSPIGDAGHALGWLVKEMLSEDERLFDTSPTKVQRKYWHITSYLTTQRSTCS